MSRSSPRKGQVEPTAALAALFAVCAGVGLYAGVLGGAVAPAERDLAEPTLERVHDATSDGGVVAPDALPAGRAAGPEGHELNVTLAAGDRAWTAGPPPPPAADRAARPASVRTAPGRIEPGRLRVAVWR